MITSQRVPLVATDPANGQEWHFASLRAACDWLSAGQLAAGGLTATYSRVAPSLSRASQPGQDGATAYGYEWRRVRA